MAKITVEYLESLLYDYELLGMTAAQMVELLNEKAAEVEPCECEIYKPESIDHLNCRECGGLPLPNKPVN